MTEMPAVRWQRNVVLAAQRANTRLSSSLESADPPFPGGDRGQQRLCGVFEIRQPPELQCAQMSATTSRDHGWDRSVGAFPRCHPAGLIIRSLMPNCRRSHWGMTCSFVAVDFVRLSRQNKQNFLTTPAMPFSCPMLTSPFSLSLSVSRA